jgi:glutamate-1-semialdehyde 2,1-aminomutase
VDGNGYIDYVGSWGPLILGHAHPEVLSAINEAAQRGTTFGIATELEVELAEAVSAAMPSIEMLRFVSSGTEATMSAIRVARAATGRDLIIKFEGGYHGHADGLLVQAGSGAAAQSTPDSAGVPAAYASQTLVAPYNDLTAVESLFTTHPLSIAAIIVEPIAANMGLVLPGPGFLEGLRRLASDHGALLIFDEVITGFRVAYGGAQALYGIAPDLTCLGKVVGGGLPAAAYGGRRELMELVAPLGPVYQAGTLAGNPLAMAAGLATLRLLRQPNTYETLAESGRYLAKGLAQAAKEAEVPIAIPQLGSLLTVFFRENVPQRYQDVLTAEGSRYAAFFHALLDRGVYFPPSPFEVAFCSLAHTRRDLDETIEAARSAFAAVAS